MTNSNSATTLQNHPNAEPSTSRGDNPGLASASVSLPIAKTNAPTKTAKVTTPVPVTITNARLSTDVTVTSDRDFWKPHDATAFYTLLLALATVVLAGITTWAILREDGRAREARKATEEDRVAVVARDDEAARATTRAILARLRSWIIELSATMSANLPPLGEEINVDAVVSRLLQQDVQHAFGVNYPIIVEAGMRCANAAAALRAFREEANRHEMMATDAARDTNTLKLWASERPDVQYSLYLAKGEIAAVSSAFAADRLRVSMQPYQNALVQTLQRTGEALERAVSVSRTST